MRADLFYGLILVIMMGLVYGLWLTIMNDRLFWYHKLHSTIKKPSNHKQCRQRTR